MNFTKKNYNLISDIRNEANSPQTKFSNFFHPQHDCIRVQGPIQLKFNSAQKVEIESGRTIFSHNRIQPTKKLTYKSTKENDRKQRMFSFFLFFSSFSRISKFFSLLCCCADVTTEARVEKSWVESEWIVAAAHWLRQNGSLNVVRACFHPPFAHLPPPQNYYHAAALPPCPSELRARF